MEQEGGGSGGSGDLVAKLVLLSELMVAKLVLLSELMVAKLVLLAKRMAGDVVLARQQRRKLDI